MSNNHENTAESERREVINALQVLRFHLGNTIAAVGTDRAEHVHQYADLSMVVLSGVAAALDSITAAMGEEDSPVPVENHAPGGMVSRYRYLADRMSFYAESIERDPPEVRVTYEADVAATLDGVTDLLDGLVARTCGPGGDLPEFEEYLRHRQDRLGSES